MDNKIKLKTRFYYLGKFFISLFCIFLVASCENFNKRREINHILTEWIDKEIYFPDISPCHLQGKNTITDLNDSIFETDYKILIYIDSTGCTDCRSKLFLWKQLIEESDSLFKTRLSFIFYFQPKKNKKKEIDLLLYRNRFNHTVFIDENNSIDSLNHFPKNPDYQCFLLDSLNKVVAIGNPIYNNWVWILYKTQIKSNNNLNDSTTWNNK